MPVKHTEATSGRRELGEELGRLRRERNYSGNDVARKLGWSPSRISRLENGLTGATSSHLATLLAFYQVSEEVFARLFELNQAALDHSRVRPHRELLLDEVWLPALHEATAARVTEYAPLAVPTLLQTPEYARALLLGSGEPAPGEEVARRLTALEQRQASLRLPSTTFRFFLAEHLLRAPVGDKEVMGAQLRHLIATSARYECTVRVLPDSAGSCAVFGSAFRILEYADSRDVVCTHTQSASIFQEDPEDVAIYRAIQDRLHRVALDKEQSIQVINDLAIGHTGIIQPIAYSSINGHQPDNPR